MTRRALQLSLAVGFALASGSAHGRTEPFDPFHAAGIDARPGAAIPLDARFEDESGRWVTLRQLAHGRPLVLAPVQHRCPNLCGLTLEGLQAAVAGQGYRPGKDFVLVAMSIDPRETLDATRLSEQRLVRGAADSDGVHALVGPPQDIAAVTGALGYRYAWDPRLGQYAHIAAVAVLTPRGRLARWLYGVAPKPQDLHLALTDAGRGRLGDLGDRIRLLCYHYDPSTGRYSSLIWSTVRWSAAATVAGLGALIAWGVLRGRRRSGGVA